MSGGYAYVLDEDGGFESRCNTDMVGLEPVTDDEDIATLRDLIEEHVRHTGSGKGSRVLADWDDMLPKFVKVFPHDFRRVLEERKQRGLEVGAVAGG